MAAAVIILTCALLIAGVIRQAMKRRKRYIDLRDRLAPYDRDEHLFTNR